MDATIDFLTGARILKAERRGVYLELTVDKGAGPQQFITSDRHVLVHTLHCFGCGEERLCEVVETAGMREGVCGVCGRSWKLDKG